MKQTPSKILFAGLILTAVLGMAAALLQRAGFDQVPGAIAGAPRAGDGQALWVDPLNGSDAADGSSRSRALRTINEAWRRIPAGVALTTGYTIELTAGVYPSDTIPNYWEDRHGTATAPIVLRAADSPRSARIQGNINMYDVRHLSFIDLVVENAGDVFHCELCFHLTIDNVEFDGGDREAHETIKINQSQYITIEDSSIHGSYENAIDFVAVQYAVLRRNRIFDADDWCAYVKGGSAYITVESNEIFNCGTGGFTAGQGTGFEYMEAPWLHYEAYAVRVINNLIHDTEGAGFGVNGGYDILFAHNTLYRVGTRSHLVEVVHGIRSCDGDAARCSANYTAGGWGPSTVGAEAPIPNRNVLIYNNLIVNPAGVQSEWQQLTVNGPMTPPGGMRVPSPARTDDQLQIVGNVIWNGPADHALGIGDDSGCQPANVTCNATQVLQDNAVNTIEPRFVAADAGDFRLENPADLPAAQAIPDFAAWAQFTPAVPAAADLRNTVTVDFAGNRREGYDLVGAIAANGAPPLPTPTALAVPTAVRLYVPLVTRMQARTATVAVP